MKLEVGMYVRTDNGIIGKIYEKIGDMFTYKDSNRDYITYGGLHNEILKASHNPIDLIEVGDYVNDVKILDIKMKCDGKIKCLITNGYDITNEMIKSVVTKEQFESMSYKLEVEE